jgi:2-polyprenyl-6-methoxyphenol hydroxylase-like FAD-dependent oxidoreductase
MHDNDMTGVEAHSTSVLVVGAGPAGLVTAIGLARHGVPVMLVEKREQTSSFPRATAVSPRSMEIMRDWGLEDLVRAREFDALPTGRVAPTLVAAEGMTVPLGFPTEDESRRVSPTSYAVVAQDEFEPVLLEHLGTFPAEVRFGTEIVSFHQDETGVTSVLRDTTGRRTTVRSRFLVGADGSRSSVRSALGIPMQGPDHLEEFVSTLFRAPLRAQLPAVHGLNMIPGPQGLAVMLPTSNDDRWVFAQAWDPLTQRVEDFSHEQVTASIRAAAGVPDLPVEILSVGAFSFAAQVADRYREGHAFLVGDAAHRITPRGGTGMNTAIQDAHNLAWKLAFVLHGRAGDDLLDTYEEERRPVGARNAARSEAPTSPDLDPIAIDIGVTYERGALAGDGTSTETTEAGWRPTGRPGARLPHVWLERDGDRVSTLDLLGPGMTVFTGPDGARWRAAADAVASEVGVTVSVRVVGGAPLCDPAGEFSTLFGLEPDGAVVVRPDGHIAWRARSAAGLDLCCGLGEGIRASLGERPSLDVDERGAA